MKTKIMSPNDIQVTLDNHTLEVFEEYVNLGHIRLDRENQTAEITRRNDLSWAAFEKLRRVLQKLVNSH